MTSYNTLLMFLLTIVLLGLGFTIFGKSKDKVAKPFLIVVTIIALIPILIITYAQNNVTFSQLLSSGFIYASVCGLLIVLVYCLSIYKYHKIGNNKIIGLGLIYSGVNLAVFITNDLKSSLILVEVLPILGFLLISIKHYSSNLEGNRLASFKYLILHIFSSMMIAIGFDYLADVGNYHLISNLVGYDSWIKYLILVGLLINVAVITPNLWLPEALHNSNSKSVLFLNIFITKPSLFILLKMFLGFTPLIYIGILVMITASFFSILTTKYTKIVGFSSIYRIGLILVLAGLFKGDYSYYGNLLQILIFSLIIYDVILFIVNDILIHHYKTNNLNKVVGCFHQNQYFKFLFLLISLISISIPFSMNFNPHILYDFLINTNHLSLLIVLGFALALASLHSGFRIYYILCHQSANQSSDAQQILIPKTLIIVMTLTVVAWLTLTIRNISWLLVGMLLISSVLIILSLWLFFMCKRRNIFAKFDHKFLNFNNIIIDKSTSAFGKVLILYTKLSKIVSHHLGSLIIKLLHAIALFSHIKYNQKLVHIILICFILLGFLLMMGFYV